MPPIKLILLVFAFVLLLIASWPPANTRVSVGWLGLALFVLTFLIP